MANKLKLIEEDGRFIVVDNNENIVFDNIHDAHIFKYWNKRTVIRFTTIDNEHTEIDFNGLFFSRFSYLEYDMVSMLVPYPGVPAYKTSKDGKYGIINAFNTIPCIFDKIEFLSSNLFDGADVIKVIKDDKYSLIHGTGKYVEPKGYNYIYTPIQPLDKYIVCDKGKYGFIDHWNLVEIVEPQFNSIEELCAQYGCNMDKYTIDIYCTNQKLTFERTNNTGGHSFVTTDANYTVRDEMDDSWAYITEDMLHKAYQPKLCPNRRLNKYGYFYNLFDCRKYDDVENVIGKYYIVKKNGRFGLADDEFNIILALCYLRIHQVEKNLPLLVVSDWYGDFLYNLETGLRTRMFGGIISKRLHHGKLGNYQNYLVYWELGKLGLITPDGQIMVKAKFNEYVPWVDEMPRKEHAYFREEFNGRGYTFYIDDDKFYGLIPIDKYDTCLRIGRDVYSCFYVSKIRDKYVLLNRDGEELKLPKLDSIIFNQRIWSSIFGRYDKCSILSETFIIGRINHKYSLFSAESVWSSTNVTSIISDCDEMELLESASEPSYVRFKKNDVNGYVNEDGEIISPEIYDEITSTDFHYYLISKSGKLGLLNSRMKFILPCLYDNIAMKDSWTVKLVENGVERETSITQRRHRGFSIDSTEPRTYAEYAGSYAQDVMGYSDDDIDTIFDGDPDAYWNID